jgi:hypothetical protein
MSLFPSCSFELLVASGTFRVGEENECQLVLRTDERIVRARAISVDFRSSAWMGFGSDEHHSVVRHVLHSSSYQLRLPDTGLAAGESRYPLRLVVPASQLVSYEGENCATTLELRVNLDVDWAVDPHTTFSPKLVFAPKRVEARPIAFRTDRSFHDRFLLELTLESAVVAEGEQLEGAIALRAGTSELFDALTLTLASSMSLLRPGYAEPSTRTRDAEVIRIDAERMRKGVAVPFSFPIGPAHKPNTQAASVVLANLLNVRIDVPSAADPSFHVPLMVLPRGSTVLRAYAPPATGPAPPPNLQATSAMLAKLLNERIDVPTAAAPSFRAPPVVPPRGSVDLSDHAPPGIGINRVVNLARELSTQFDSVPADSDQIFRIRRGVVVASLQDASNHAQLGLTHRLDFPELGLGLRAERFGMLTGFRPSSLLPPGLAADFQIDWGGALAAGTPELNAAEALVRGITESLGACAQFSLSDHHVSWFYPYHGAELPFALAAAKKLERLAESADRLIMDLQPLKSLGDSLQAYRRCAETLGACARPLAPEAPLFLPSRPAILGIRNTYRIGGGEIRTFVAHIDTNWRAEGLLRKRVSYTQLALIADGFDFCLPNDVRKLPTLANNLPAVVCAAFGNEVHVEWSSPSHLVISGDVWLHDPAELLPVVEQLADWAIELRGERRANAPYR